MSRRLWIKDALNNGGKKGSLRRWAKKHRLMTSRDTVDIPRGISYAKRHGETRRLKQLTLARTLRRLNR